ncbi:hypothetical protein TSAR_012339, partial [Trichomalopsis sarcophagae]
SLAQLSINAGKNIVYSARYKIKGGATIVYYVPREEKTWTVHISCKLSPEPKTRVANMRYWLFNFPPVLGILFFFIPAPKCTLFSRRSGGNVQWLLELDWKVVPPLNSRLWCPHNLSNGSRV